MVEEVGENDGAGPVDWDAVGADYRGGELTVARIREKYGISERQLTTVRKARGWLPRRWAKPVQIDLIERLMRLVDHQILLLEQRHLAAGDKEVALIGNLTRTLERLMELKAQAGDSNPAPRGDGAEIRRMREELIQRMREIEGP